MARALRCCRTASAVALVVISVACRATSAPPDPNNLLGIPVGEYQAVDLGTLGGPTSTAADVNIRNQVVGASATADGLTHAFLWQDGVMTDLGTLGGSSSSASHINERGQVVGLSANAAGEDHVFLWSDGVMQDLGPGPVAYVSDVLLNERGQVAWTSWPAGGTPAQARAFLWTDGVAQELGALGDTGNTRAKAINDLGQVVGESNGRPFLWENGVIRELPGLGGGGWASDINDRGQVVGASYDGDPPTSTLHAVLWDGDQITQLGKLPEDTHSAGSLINQAGMVIVHSYPFSWSYPRDFLWTAGVITRLTPLNWRYTANGLNDLGVVAGTQDSTFFETRAVVWKLGERTRLPLLSGVANFAAALNNAGTVVGSERISRSSLDRRAVLWRESISALTATR